MDNPRHRKAEALIASQGGRQRTGYVVECILAARQSVDLDQLVRRAVRDELQCLSHPVRRQQEQDGNVQLSDLPDTLIHAMDDLGKIK